jgi:hypothetical protein
MFTLSSENIKWLNLEYLAYADSQRIDLVTRIALAFLSRFIPNSQPTRRGEPLTDSGFRALFFEDGGRVLARRFTGRPNTIDPAFTTAAPLCSIAHGRQTGSRVASMNAMPAS